MHYSVMLNEVINGLNIKNDGIYVDATIGLAGHSKVILSKIPNGFLYGFDQDDYAIKQSNEVLSKVSNNYKLLRYNFKDMKKVLNENGIKKVDGILLDLGVSSPQIDDSTRGFSFMKDSLLDMRMDKRNELTAHDIINNYSESDLLNIFYKYGEEKTSKNIVKNIINKRKEKEINTTLELVNIIKDSVGSNYFYKNHPERKIFQSLRIEVNKELDVLESTIPDAIDLLNKGGRLVIITFHSLEDRIVKKLFKKYSEVDSIVKGLPNIPDEYKAKIKIINNKVILPTEEELLKNSRSKSAKLRIIERI